MSGPGYKKVMMSLIASTFTLYFTLACLRTFTDFKKSLSVNSSATQKERIEVGEDIKTTRLRNLSATSTMNPEVVNGTFKRTTTQKPSPAPSRPTAFPQFHLIKQFFRAQTQGKYAKFPTKQQEERNKEYMRVLQSNLNHAHVARIHLFYIRDEDIKAVYLANLTNMWKLQPVKWHRLLHMADFFLYASRNLINKLVIALNSDIALGEGFQRVNPDLLLKQKRFYSLTRYETNLSCSIGHQMCTRGYIGSHDTHIFALAKPLNETLLLKKLDYPINMYQAENGMIYTMRNFFGFTVSNPCKVLKTYHHHCSVVHGPAPGGNYTIYSLGWTKKEVFGGVAGPSLL